MTTTLLLLSFEYMISSRATGALSYVDWLGVVRYHIVGTNRTVHPLYEYMYNFFRLSTSGHGGHVIIRNDKQRSGGHRRRQIQ